MLTNLKKHWLFIFILIFGGFLRFYKLDWGQGLYTHPDEYHIVGALSQLIFPSQMNPHFYNYGTAVIYPIYFINQLLLNLRIIINPFIIGRFLSAIFSTLTLVFVYKISNYLFKNKDISLLSTLFCATTVGLVQQAHFLTPESELIFFLLGSLSFDLEYLNSKKFMSLIWASIFLGLSLGVKVSGAVFALPLFITILIPQKGRINQVIFNLLVSFCFVVLFFFLSAPFDFLDFTNFYSSFQYESSLAWGTIPVFYTTQFENTIPFIFQFQKILPFALGPVLLILGSLGLLLMIHLAISKKNSTFLVFLTAFLATFISSGILYAKWTRFFSPTFAFFAISCTFLIVVALEKLTSKQKIFLFSIFTILHFVWILSFFSIYFDDDIRISASSWIQENIPSSTKISYEGGNTIDVPTSGNFVKISDDFYQYEQNTLIQNQIVQNLATSDYFIVESRRVFTNYQRLPQKYPKTARFYDQLFSGNLGFVPIKVFTSYPKIELGSFLLEFPDEGAEETFTVFDHPVIRVYKNQDQKSYAQLKTILQI